MTASDRLLAVGIAGSPRRRGNSSSLLNSYLEGAASVGFDTEFVYLNELTYKEKPEVMERLRGAGVEQAREVVELLRAV